MAEYTNQIAAVLLPVWLLPSLATQYQNLMLQKCDQPGRFVFDDGTELDRMDVYGMAYDDIAEMYRADRERKEAPPPG